MQALSDLFNILILLVVLGIGLIIYLIPTIIAFMRGKRDRVAIGALNLLLGWTFLGWVLAFVWSLKSD